MEEILVENLLLIALVFGLGFFTFFVKTLVVKLLPDSPAKLVENGIKSDSHAPSWVDPMGNYPSAEGKSVDEECPSSVDWRALRAKRDSRSGKPEIDDWFKPREGLQKIRLLPPPNRELFGGPYKLIQAPLWSHQRLHYIDGVGNQCRKEADDRPGAPYIGNCPICDHYEYLQKESESKRHGGYYESRVADSRIADELKMQARDIRPIDRYYYNVLVDGETKLWSIGKAVHTQIIKQIVKTDDPHCGITNGRNITVKSDLTHHYLVTELSFGDPSHLLDELTNADHMERVLAGQWDLDGLIEKWYVPDDKLYNLAAKVRGQNTACCPTCNKWRFFDGTEETAYCSYDCLSKRQKVEGA